MIELSILEITILIAVLKLQQKQQIVFNFELVYEEYKQFIKQCSSMGTIMAKLNYAKPVALAVIVLIGFWKFGSVGRTEVWKGSCEQVWKRVQEVWEFVDTRAVGVFEGGWSWAAR